MAKIYYLTPPVRAAVVELANAYHRYLAHSAASTIHRKRAAIRLLAAQDAFNIELISRRTLEIQSMAVAA